MPGAGQEPPGDGDPRAFGVDGIWASPEPLTAGPMTPAPLTAPPMTANWMTAEPLTADRPAMTTAETATATATATRAAATPAASRLDRAIWAVTGMLRRHWLIALLLAAGLILRAITQLAYEPALLFIDSKKYIFGTDFTNTDWGSFDPLGYTLFLLRPVLMVADLAFVALVQHVLGIAMGVALYVLMLRKGVARWLAAVAVAPVLLDANQLNAEQTIMPDVLFEALLVAGLVLLLWQPRPGLGFVILGGLVLGSSAPVRQVGEALIVPALIYVIAASKGWRTRRRPTRRTRCWRCCGRSVRCPAGNRGS